MAEFGLIGPACVDDGKVVLWCGKSPDDMTREELIAALNHSLRRYMRLLDESAADAKYVAAGKVAAWSRGHG